MKPLDEAYISCISLITPKPTVYNATVNQISSNLQTELDLVSSSKRERGEPLVRLEDGVGNVEKPTENLTRSRNKSDRCW